MQDVHEAVSALGEVMGMDGVAFDRDGNLTLIFDGTMAVNFHRIDETGLELWAELPELGSPSDPAALSSILAANHLGDGTGAARLALTPDRSAFVLCERVSVANATARSFGEAVSQFARTAAFWRSREGRQLVESRSGASGSISHEPFSMIRV